MQTNIEFNDNGKFICDKFKMDFSKKQHTLIIETRKVPYWLHHYGKNFYIFFNKDTKYANIGLIVRGDKFEFFKIDM